MAAERVFADAGSFGDGSRYEMVATHVPESEDYPEGVKYRFQYVDADGRTLLGFDNFPHHPDVGRHHYHTLDGVHDDIEFVDLRTHVRRSYAAVDDRREE